MLIWILALVLLALGAFCGYKAGAIRTSVALVGLILAAALAVPLGPSLRSLVPMIGLKNPIWPYIVPPVFVFLVLYGIFIGVAFFVHRKVELFYKYKSEDTQRFRWERVNKALGLGVGLITGTVWLFLVSLVIYMAGYLAVQVTSDQTNSIYVKFLAQAREDMHSTGLDKAVAPFDPLPPRFYQACDIIGLIYQNPILISRISQYPPFLLLGERQEFQDLAKDTEFNQMLLTKADAVEILKNPKIQGLMLNQDVVQDLLGQDFNDFQAYLQSGISPKYAEEKILGKWKLDPYATLAQERKKHPDMSSTVMRRMKTVILEIMPALTVTATTDKKVAVKADVAEKLRQLYNPPAPKVVAAPAQAAPGMSQATAQRYGLRGQQQCVVVAAPAPQPAKTNEPPFLVFSAQGTWEHIGDNKYELKTKDEKGKSDEVEATADDERLTVFGPTGTMVFTKAD